jgi:hypothetical protein
MTAAARTVPAISRRDDLRRASSSSAATAPQATKIAGCEHQTPTAAARVNSAIPAQPARVSLDRAALPAASRMTSATAASVEYCFTSEE